MSQRMQQGQSMIILGEDSRCISGQDAQSMDITVGKAAAEVVRTTFGPKGIDRMLVDSGRQIVIVDDGVTILREMDIDHPAVNMAVEVSETQEDEVGSGMTMAAINAGEPLDQAEDLFDSDIHMTTITQGYRQAVEKAKEVPEDGAIEIAEDDHETLMKIAATAMTGKGAESVRDPPSELVVDAVLTVKDDDGIDTNSVSVEKVVGGIIDSSEFIEGVIVDKERVDENMPYAVEDTNIIIPDDALEVCETEINAGVNVADPDQLQQFLDQEGKQLKETVDQLVEVGADAVFIGDSIDDMTQHYLVKEGIFVVYRAKFFDLKRLTRTTGDRVVSSLGDIEADDLGFVGSVGQKDVSGDECIFVEDVESAKSVALIFRGGTEHVIDELEHAIEDSLGVVRMTLEDGKVLPGGGTPETELSLQLRELVDSVGGRGQLTVEVFAEALDITPYTLAENTDLDPIDSLVGLHSRHDGGEFAAGFDAYTDEVIGMEEEDVAELLRVKTQAIESVTEVVIMILRIDSVVVAGGLFGGQTDSGDDDGNTPSGMGGGMGNVGGMGGMGGTM